MGCATGTLKYSLFLFNVLWAILGILVLVFAGLGWGAMPDEYAIGTIILGGFILVISLFGCCGAARESPRMLWTYVSLLLTLLVLIVCFIFLSPKGVFKEYALKTVEDHWELEQTKPGSMDLIQNTYHCCGRDSPKDYLNSHFWNNTVPSSCCKDNSCVNPLNLYVQGCIARVEEAFADEQSTLSYFQWGLLIFEAVILLLAIVLAIHYTNRQRRYNY
ncbi:23 kDa integral membrane protein [Drosophila biarmipes]|uniref:23 kDa integral membrane protein n=1 Tax=Drosophila biarmipes TaxID=125945 RepID=UPI0007E62E97|nr:23 kDa integral membrane protein [Drosophila biarmipes]